MTDDAPAPLTEEELTAITHEVAGLSVVTTLVLQNLVNSYKAQRRRIAAMERVVEAAMRIHESALWLYDENNAHMGTWEIPEPRFTFLSEALDALAALEAAK